MQTRRPIAAFDIDGTVIRWQLYHAIGDELARRGFIPTDTFAAVRAARMNWKKRDALESFKTYESLLVGAFDDAIKGMAVSEFSDIAHHVFDEYKEQVYVYSRDLMQRLKDDNYLLFAISGSPSIIVKQFTKFYGFDDYAATEYTVENKHFTGEKQVSIGKKAELLQQLLKKHGAVLRGSVAIGDSEGDISMLELVERPIAFNPSKGLYDKARSCGWEIIVERKNVVYQLQPDDDRYLLGGV